VAQQPQSYPSREVVCNVMPLVKLQHQGCHAIVADICVIEIHIYYVVSYTRVHTVGYNIVGNQCNIMYLIILTSTLVCLM
jgi:hypothetical protein